MPTAADDDIDRDDDADADDEDDNDDDAEGDGEGDGDNGGDEARPVVVVIDDDDVDADDTGVLCTDVFTNDDGRWIDGCAEVGQSWTVPVVSCSTLKSLSAFQEMWQGYDPTRQ